MKLRFVIIEFLLLYGQLIIKFLLLDNVKEIIKD